MKAFHILAAGIVLCAALASCEMKDELKGTGNGTNADMGYLDLGVAVNGSQNNVTKAEVEDGDIEVGATVSAEDFPVVITGVTDASFIKEYDGAETLIAKDIEELYNSQAYLHDTEMIFNVSQDNKDDQIPDVKHDKERNDKYEKIYLTKLSIK